MHGIIFAELKKFVRTRFGPDAWQRISDDAGVKRLSNLATESYPDEELVALVTAASTMSGIPAPQLLEEFGEFMVPDLVKVFGGFLDRHWRLLDLLEHTETVIHRAVRMQDAKAEPPKLKITRTSPTEVVILYSSPRRLCAVAKGIIAGFSKHYNEAIAVRETTCMHLGARECTLVASRVVEERAIA